MKDRPKIKVRTGQKAKRTAAHKNRKSAAKRGDRKHKGKDI